MPQSVPRPGSGSEPLFLPAPADLPFPPPGPDPLVFPRDHGIHHRSGTEIWQWIGYLDTAAGRRFGLEVTVLRVDLDTEVEPRRSAWASDQVFHLIYAITPFAQGEIYRSRETSRAALGLAGYDRQRHSLWIGRREFVFRHDPALPDMELTIPDRVYPLRLKLDAVRPVVISPRPVPFRYYADTSMTAAGVLTIAGEALAVSGSVWFEHSWGKLPVRTGQLVRNRFMLQLSNGTDLNLLQSRRRDGTGKAVNGGYMISLGASPMALEHDDLNIDPSGHWTSRISGVRYPVRWRIRIPGQALVLDLRPWMDDQETTDLLTGWTGMVSVSGQAGAAPVTGFGRVQSSGYLAPNRN
jgi:predicted secreted hydrolase